MLHVRFVFPLTNSPCAHAPGPAFFFLSFFFLLPNTSLSLSPSPSPFIPSFLSRDPGAWFSAPKKIFLFPHSPRVGGELSKNGGFRKTFPTPPRAILGVAQSGGYTWGWARGWFFGGAGKRDKERERGGDFANE